MIYYIPLFTGIRHN